MDDLRSTLAPLLDKAREHALDYLAPSAPRAVAATTSPAELRNRLALPLNDDPRDPAAVLDELVRSVEGGLVDSTGGRFFAWVIGGTLPAALAADWMTSAWDQNAAIFATSPAAAAVEEAAGRWLKDVLRLPAEASFALTTGCQSAHVTCLAAARHALLERRGWNVEKQGLAGAPSIRILTSTERHSTTPRAARFLGLGEDNVVELPADANGRLAPETLRAAFEEREQDHDRPTIVVLQAGDLNIGAFDDFAALIPIAHEHKAWVHIDGAMGLWASASPKLRHLLNGFEHADSWTTDGHKWLNVPYDCGYAFIADRSAHRAAFTVHASYFILVDDTRDEMDWNLEWSRRSRGFATWAALRSLGRRGVADLIERCCAHCHALVTRIGSLPHAEMLAEPIINQGLVRFLDPKPNAMPADHDAFTDRIIEAIRDSGEAFFTGVSWQGKRAMRVSVSSWQTTGADVDRVVACTAAILAKASAE